jgi:hypothetical protein
VPSARQLPLTVAENNHQKCWFFIWLNQEQLGFVGDNWKVKSTRPIWNLDVKVIIARSNLSTNKPLGFIGDL